MRRDMVFGADSKRAEALDAATGPAVFAVIVAAMGAVVGLAGWAAATYTSVAVVLGCAVGSAIVTALMWGVLHWGIDEPVEAQTAITERQEEATGFRHAA